MFINSAGGSHSPPANKPKKMKYITFFAFMALMVWACTPPADRGQEPIEYSATMSSGFWQDAAAFATATLEDDDTLTYDLGSFNRPISIELQVSGDSLSGATDVTVFLEQSINGTDFAVVATKDTAINGAGTSNTRLTADFLGGTIRARAVGDGTQETIVRMDALIAQSQPTQ